MVDKSVQEYKIRRDLHRRADFFKKVFRLEEGREAELELRTGILGFHRFPQEAYKENRLTKFMQCPPSGEVPAFRSGGTWDMIFRASQGECRQLGFKDVKTLWRCREYLDQYNLVMLPVSVLFWEKGNSLFGCSE